MTGDNFLKVVLLLVVAIVLIAITESTFEELDKKRCHEMPFSEMIKDSSCDKYWRDN